MTELEELTRCINDNWDRLYRFNPEDPRNDVVEIDKLKARITAIADDRNSMLENFRAVNKAYVELDRKTKLHLRNSAVENLASKGIERKPLKASIKTCSRFVQ